MSKRLITVVTAAVLIMGTAFWAGVVQPWNASAAAASVIGPADPAVAAAEQQRLLPGSQIRAVTLTAAAVTLDIGGRQVGTWAFNGQVPGPEIRAQAGDVVRAEVINELPDPLTVHWHGIALRNDMDGVPGLTQSPIAPGQHFTYEFTVPTSGTYFYHSHVGTQLDRGLYGPLIVTSNDPAEAPQRDITMMFDDWTDGVGPSPDEQLAQLQSTSGNTNMGGMDHGSGGMSGMSGMDHGSMGGTDGGATATSMNPLGADTADVKYPMYLVNGRASPAPAVFATTPGEQVRLRLINAAASTPFRVAFSGGTMTVIATDGYPVQSATAQSLIIGMGERYDVLVTAPKSGSESLVALAEGQDARTMSVLHTSGTELPSPTIQPAGLAEAPLALPELHAAASVALPARIPDRSYQVALTGAMRGFDWGISAPGEGGITLPVQQGQRVRLELSNNTMMWHPIHLHGHTFQVVTGDGNGPRKDTVAIAPMSTVTVEFDADNPGQWMLHCHNIYHAEAGMMTTLTYVK